MKSQDVPADAGVVVSAYAQAQTEHLGIPYVTVTSAVQREDGTWVRRAWYPELPEVVSESDDTFEALDNLEALRREYVRTAVTEHRTLAVPRTPLEHLIREEDLT